jgi:hypothetical protein
MPVSPDAISAKFADLQELHDAILKAQNDLGTTRGDYMRFQTGTMTVGWADTAGEENQIRNSGFDQYGQMNEEFLGNLRVAVERSIELLRGAVVRSQAAIAAT